MAAIVSPCLSLSGPIIGHTATNQKQHPRTSTSSSASQRPSPALLPQFPHGIYNLHQRSILRYRCSESGSMARRVMAMSMVALLSVALLFSSSPVMAAEADQPKDFEYYQIWVSQDGETHFAECKMKGFNLTAYASLPQYLRTDFGGAPIEMVLTELPVGLAQPLHSTPQVQFVVTLSGSWYIETTDGTRHNFKKGQLLFQDNTAKSPADKQPMHYSGTHGDKPCHQLIVQLSRPPQVDNPCPFDS